MRIQTYHRVWGLKRVIYHIQRLKLPFPINLSEVVIFIGAEAVSLYLSRFALYRIFPFSIRYLLFPGGLTWVLSRLEPEGRAPYLLVASLARHAKTPKIWARGIPAKQKRVKAKTLTLIVAEGGSPSGNTDED